MIKTKLGKTTMNVSQIIYGGIVSRNDGQENSDKYVAYAMEHGVNYYDISPSYGDSEEKLGNSLIPYRKDIYLACKTGMRDGEGAKRELDASLNTLHTDYFDVYQMHSLMNVDEVETAFAKNGAFEVFLKAKEEGIAKHLGVTCHCEEAALRALELFDFDTILFPTNWGLHMNKDFGTRISKVCVEKQVGFLGMKSMIHRAWLGPEEKAVSRFQKSWCKPISENDPFTIAAMKYAFQTIGAQVLVTPGNFENFSFAVEHIDELQQPLTEAEINLLKAESKEIVGHYFF